MSKIRVKTRTKWQAKLKFIDTVIKMDTDNRFEGKQYFTMEQIRNAYKQGV